MPMIHNQHPQLLALATGWRAHFIPRKKIISLCVVALTPSAKSCLIEKVSLRLGLWQMLLCMSYSNWESSLSTTGVQSM